MASLYRGAKGVWLMAFKQLREEARGCHDDKMHRMVGGAVDKQQDEKMIRGAMRQHDDQQHAGKLTKLKFADGGAVDMPSGERRDRRARGGANHKKGAPHVNVIVAPSMHSQPPGGPLGMPPGGAPLPHPPVPMGPPPGPPMPMPGGAPGGMAGGPPIGAMAPKVPMPMPGGMGMGMGPRARGGQVSYPIDDGAGGGKGRLEKIAAYGRNADKGEGRKRGGRA